MNIITPKRIPNKLAINIPISFSSENDRVRRITKQIYSYKYSFEIHLQARNVVPTMI
jgi:hypothetical protein